MALFQQPRDASEVLSEGFFSAQVVSWENVLNTGDEGKLLAEVLHELDP